MKEINDVKELINKYKIKKRFYSYEDIEDACYYMILNNEPSFSKALQKTGFLNACCSIKKADFVLNNTTYEKNLEEEEKEVIEKQERVIKKKREFLFGSNEKAKQNKKVLENLAKLKKLSRS